MLRAGKTNPSRRTGGSPLVPLVPGYQKHKQQIDNQLLILRKHIVGHLGHVTLTMNINFCFSISRILHIRFGFDWSSG